MTVFSFSRVDSTSLVLALLLSIAVAAFSPGCSNSSEDTASPTADKEANASETTAKAASTPSKAKAKPKKALTKPNAVKKQSDKDAPEKKRSITLGRKKATKTPPEPGSETPTGLKKKAEKTPNMLSKKASGKVNDPFKDSPAATTSPARIPTPALAKKQAPGANPLKSVFTRNDVKLTTGFKGLLRQTPLAGAKTSTTYNALRLKPSGSAAFGAGLQVWTVKIAGRQTRMFNNFLKQYPSTTRNRDIGDSAFFASFGDVQYLVWLDRKRKFLAAVTCDSIVCKRDGDLLKLARRLNNKIPQAIN